MHEIDNEDRRGWGRVALDAFGAETGQTGYAYDNADCLGEIAGDLICALLHLADAAGLNADALIERGRDHYDHEREDDEDDEDDDACDECGVPVPAEEPDLVNTHHAPTCSLHPDNVITPWDRSQGPKPYDHPARPGDDNEPGDRCKDCGDDVTWTGPNPNDWLHVDAQDWRHLA